ncbi:hypothetical protein V1477_007731 [Vespula maculifrons]|uniref:Uncharacterized protein n=1 Tax=Vespula maculifrons TaxID=7453 RepID=A0ABD2CFK1_VESMC
MPYTQTHLGHCGFSVSIEKESRKGPGMRRYINTSTCTVMAWNRPVSFIDELYVPCPHQFVDVKLRYLLDFIEDPELLVDPYPPNRLYSITVKEKKYRRSDAIRLNATKCNEMQRDSKLRPVCFGVVH